MTYDAANVLGFMLGATHDYLTKGIRDNTTYSYSRCSSNERRKYIRGLCRVRAALIDEYDNIQFMLESVRKKDHPEEHVFAKQKLLKLPHLAGNPTKEVGLRYIQAEIWQRVSEEWFSSLCKDLGISTDAARGLFSLDLNPQVSRRCRELREARASVNAPVYACRMTGDMLRNDKQLLCLLGQEIETVAHADDAVPEIQPDWESMRRQAEDIESFTNFCVRHAALAIEVDAENIEAYLGLPLIEHARRHTTVQVFVHTSGEISKGWYEHCIARVEDGFTHLQTDRLVSGAKNQVDISAMAHAIKEKLERPDTGIVVFSSDSDFIALANNLKAEDICVCCRKGLTSQRYIEELKSLGATVVQVVPDMLEVEARLREHRQREYFLGMLNKLLPNLRECYDSICTASQKPAFEGIRWSIKPDGTILAK